MQQSSQRITTPPTGFPADDDGGPTDRELCAAIARLDRIGALLVAVGHGPGPRSRRAAERFSAAWCAGVDRHGTGRDIATTVDWPTDAASWLKPARRLTAPDVDAWVICDTPPHGRR